MLAANSSFVSLPLTLHMLLPLSPAPVTVKKKQALPHFQNFVISLVPMKQFPYLLSVLSKNPVLDHMSFTQQSNHTF